MRFGSPLRACYAELMLVSKRATAFALAAALVGSAGLALQLFLMGRGMGVGPALWRFFGFYTILANIGAATVATAIIFRPKNKVAGARARLIAATSIIMVGVVYSVALRALWEPIGLQKVADVLLHDAAPLLWALFWFVGPHVARPWRNVTWALLPPLVYCIYALARGAVDGWFAYWFLDPTKQTPGELAASILIMLLIMLLAFSTLAALLVAVDRSLARSTKPAATDRNEVEPVDEASEASFPASDPPPWTLGQDRM